MLYFSNIRILFISLITLILVYLASSNFIKFDDNIFKKKINLGLDLQGGSYLLLEIDNKPVILQKLQTKLSNIRKFLKDKDIVFRNLVISNDNTIIFEVDESKVSTVKDFFSDKENNINPYYQKYKSYELDLLVENNEFKLNFSKYGIIEIKNS